MKVTIELPEIEGFEYTGEYRSPKEGEWFLSSIMQPYKYESCYTEGAPPFPILKKKAPEYIVVSQNKMKFVSMNAYEDALELISHIHGTDQKKLNKLKALLL